MSLAPAAEPTPFWESPWGLDPDSPAPDRSEFFPESEDPAVLEYARSMLEDYLQHNAVFFNLISGKPCHSDSYMTGVAEGNLQRAVIFLRDAYGPSDEEMGRHVSRWLEAPNTQPAMRYAALRFEALMKGGD